MSKKLRVGMIGYGFMGKAHSNAYRQAAKFFPDLPYEPELKVFCARNEDRAKQFANNWGYDQVETDWRKIVESKDVDLIDICTPNNMHKDIAIAAEQGGADAVSAINTVVGMSIDINTRKVKLSTKS